MPSYGKTELCIYSDIQSGAKEIDKFYIKAKPLGFRNILSWWPYLTGNKPKFNCKVTRLSNKTDSAWGVTLYRSHAGTNKIFFPCGVSVDIQQDHYEFKFEDEMICESGEYSYEAEIHVGVYSDKARVVTFMAKAQEDVTLTVLNVVALILAAGIGSLLTWFLMRGCSPEP